MINQTDTESIQLQVVPNEDNGGKSVALMARAIVPTMDTPTRMGGDPTPTPSISTLSESTNGEQNSNLAVMVRPQMPANRSKQAVSSPSGRVPNHFRIQRYDDQDFRVSERMEFILNRYIETGNKALVAKECLTKFGRAVTVQTLSRWMSKPLSKLYVAKRLEDQGYFSTWTEARWMKAMDDRLAGRVEAKSTDAPILKMIGEHFGWASPEHRQGGAAGAQVQINFVQANGNR